MEDLDHIYYVVPWANTSLLPKVAHHWFSHFCTAHIIIIKMALSHVIYKIRLEPRVLHVHGIVVSAAHQCKVNKSMQSYILSVCIFDNT